MKRQSAKADDGVVRFRFIRRMSGRGGVVHRFARLSMFHLNFTNQFTIFFDFIGLFGAFRFFLQFPVSIIFSSLAGLNPKGVTKYRIGRKPCQSSRYLSGSPVRATLYSIREPIYYVAPSALDGWVACPNT